MSLPIESCSSRPFLMEYHPRCLPGHAGHVDTGSRRTSSGSTCRFRLPAARVLTVAAALLPVAAAVADNQEDAVQDTRPTSTVDARQHKWSGKLSVGGSHRSGARTIVNSDLGAEVEHEYDKWRNELDASYDYDRSGDRVNTRRFQARGKTRRALPGRAYTFGLLQYKNDKLSGFDYQITEAAGIGYRVVNSRRFWWDLEVGPSLRQSRIRETEEVVQEIFFRGGSELTWKISDTAEFSNETSVLYNGNKIEVEAVTEASGFQEGDEVSNVSALDLTVIGNLTARFSMEVSYTSDPPPGGHRTETLSKVALVHRF